MGRHAGWIAFHAGVAGGADVILIPEQPFDLDRVCEYIERRIRGPVRADRRRLRGRRARRAAIREQADAPTDAFGHARLGGIGHWLEAEIEQRTGHEARATVLGHVQRGGTPTAFDRVLATRFGLHAIDAAHDGRVGEDDGAAGDRDRAGRPRGGDRRAEGRPRVLYREAEVFFG